MMDQYAEEVVFQFCVTSSIPPVSVWSWHQQSTPQGPPTQPGMLHRWHGKLTSVGWVLPLCSDKPAMSVALGLIYAMSPACWVVNIQLTQTSPPPPPFSQPHCSANSATSVHSMWTLCHWYNSMWLTGWKHQPTNQPTVPLASYIDQASHLPTNQPTMPQASYVDQASHLPIYI